MKKIFTLFMMVLIPLFLLSQETTKKLYHSKSVVSFNLLNLTDNDEQTKVREILLLDANIFYGNIYFESEKSVCKLYISPTLGVDYVQNLIILTGYEIDKSSLISPNSSQQKGIYYSKAYSFFSDFNGFMGSDVNHPEVKSHEDVYDENKAKWIEDKMEL